MSAVQPDGAVTMVATGSFFDAIFSPDGSSIYAVSGNVVSVIDVATGETTETYTVGTKLGGLTASADGHYLAVVEESTTSVGTVHLIDLVDHSASTLQVPGTSTLFDAAFLQDGTLAVSQAAAAPLTIIDLGDGSTHTVGTAVSPQPTLEVSADATYLIAQGMYPSEPLQTYDLKTGGGFLVNGISDPYAGAALPPPPTGVGAVSPDGSLIVQADTLQVYETATQTLVSLSDTYPYLERNGVGATFSPDGHSLYLLTYGGELIQFDTTSWNVSAVYNLGARPVAERDDYYNYKGFGDVLQASSDGTHLSFIGTSGIEIVDLSLLQSAAGPGADNLRGGMQYGFGGNDVLHGSGSSFMVGGEGDDTYVVASTTNTILEVPGQGHDMVESSVSYELPANVEDLVLQGTANLSGWGNALDNAIAGNSGGNLLSGGDGNDQLTGGDGDDTLDGGEGNDILDGGAGIDVATFASATHGVTASLAITSAQDTGQGLDTFIQIDSLTGSNYNDDLSGNSDANTLLGGAGDDTLHGNGGADILDGGSGADTLAGGRSNDTYIVDDDQDVLVENPGEGTDLVISSLSFTLGDNFENLTLTGESASNGTGNALANVLTGNDSGNHLLGGDGDDRLIGNGGNDTLDGGAGIDKMYGGRGDDIYIVSDATDYAFENAGEGIDTVLASVDATLRANVENLTFTGSADLTGIGNDLDNSLTGNGGMNKLVGNAGNDTLDGGAGNDRMVGGTGDDTYYADAYNDAVIENAGEGTDSVISSSDFVLRANVENLTLTGFDDIWGYGNDLDNALTGNIADNKLFGLAGNDVIDGKGGIDRMFGGTGDDTYTVDNYSDHVLENAGEGTDTVFASVNYKLAANVENLTITGTADLWAYGNDGDNVLTGNSGANKLYGLTGNDTLNGGNGNDWLEGGAGQDHLTGGEGSDSFVFRDGDFGAATTATADRIIDFTHGEDRIRLNFVDANTLVTGDQAFSFLGTAAFDNHAGELRYEQISGNTYVEGDTNGDGIADFMIRVDGLHSLVSGDFVL